MKDFFHLLRRELADRRYFFAAALAIGFAPYLVARIANTHPAESGEVRLTIARVVLGGFLTAVPLVLGARWLVADFADGRRGFELARPLSAFSLCGSKLAAIALMIFGGAFLVSLPTTLTAWWPANLPIFELFRRGQVDTPFTWLVLLPAIAILCAWLIFTFAQALSFLLADRSRLALADLAALILFAGLLGYAYRRFDFYGAGGIAQSWVLRLGVGLAIVGIFGGFKSFQGGSLLEGSHRRHSLAMNLGLLAVGTITALATAWVVRPDAGKLIRFTLAVPNADASRWLVAGLQDLRGFEPLFAVDPGQKQATYLSPRFKLEGYPWLSADGRRIGFFRKGSGALHIYELESGTSRSIFDTHGWEKDGSFLAVDDRFESMVTIDGFGEVRVFSLQSLGRELTHQKHEDLRGQVVPIVHRDGSLFDILVHRHQVAGDVEWTVSHFVFDAKSGELRRGQSWSYPPGFDPLGPAWWREALPLLETGVGFSQLVSYPHVAALEGGRGVMEEWIGAQSENGRVSRQKRKWVIFDAKNSRLGSFEARPDFRPIGEIRPGLLLVGRDPEDIFETHPGRDAREDRHRLQTLVVAVPSGRILRVLDDFAPMKHPQGGDRVWLVDRDGAPHDLESADADPRPLLPWRPLSASR